MVGLLHGTALPLRFTQHFQHAPYIYRENKTTTAVTGDAAVKKKPAMLGSRHIGVLRAMMGGRHSGVPCLS